MPLAEKNGKTWEGQPLSAAALTCTKSDYSIHCRHINVCAEERLRAISLYHRTVRISPSCDVSCMSSLYAPLMLVRTKVTSKCPASCRVSVQQGPGLLPRSRLPRSSSLAWQTILRTRHHSLLQGTIGTSAINNVC